MYKCGGIVLLLSFFILADIPKYSTSTLIESNGTPIAVDEGFASPCVTDWNGDGKKDLHASGVYFLKVNLDGAHYTRQFTLVK